MHFKSFVSIPYIFSRIRAIKKDNGKTSTIAGSGIYGRQDGKALQAQFGSPWGITCDSSRGILVFFHSKLQKKKYLFLIVQIIVLSKLMMVTQLRLEILVLFTGLVDLLMILLLIASMLQKEEVKFQGEDFSHYMFQLE